MAKPKTMPPIDDVLAFANFVHAHSVRSASFDRMHPPWLWDRTYPRGVIMLDAPPTRLQAQFQSDGPPSLDYEKPQDSNETCRTIVLDFLEGTRALAQFLDDGTAVEGHGDSTCGHTDVLLPAPNHLLWGPSHPLFPMEPTAWIPFSAREGVDHFITPYHRGLFGTRYSYAQYGPVQLSPSPREPLFSAVPSGSGPGPFHAAVYYGSVVSFSVGEGGNEHGQGVVVLTYVKQHHRQGREHLNAMARSAASATDEPAVPDAVIGAFSAMPAHGPVPFLAIWPLLSDSSSNNDTTCWQRLAPQNAHIRHVRSAEVTRVWKTSELGGLAAMKGEPVANLAHRVDLETKPIELVNPAQPTLLRTTISLPHVQRQVDKFVRMAVPGSGDGADSDFLGCMRQRALGAFPIKELLSARAALNCALPLAMPGCFLDPNEATRPVRPAPPPVARAPLRQPPRQAAASAQQLASAQAAADAEMEAESRSVSDNASIKKGRPRKPLPQRKTVGAPAKPANKPAKAAKKVAPVPAPPATPIPPPQSDSKSITPVVLKRLKALFMELADPMQSESSAPLSAAVWENWSNDHETPYSATLGGIALADALDSWKEVLWEQLADLDAQLYQFLLEQALVNEATDVERVVERLGSRGGVTKSAEWRHDYKAEGYAPPGKNVQLLWAYTNGIRPAAGHSIWAMHCSGMWYGKRVNQGFKIKEPLSRRASESVTSSSTPNSSAKSKRKGKRASTSSVTTANKESDDPEQLEDGEAPSTQNPEAEQEVMIVPPPPPSGKNKRQKLPAVPALQPAAAASAETVPRTPGRSAARAASSSPTTSAVPATAPDSLGHPAAPAARSPATRTAMVAATAAAASVAPPAPSVPSVSRAPLATPMTASSGGSEVTAVTAVLQAMHAQQTSFLEAQARSEERAATSQRASEEAHREMLRLAQAGQKTVIDLMHSVAPFLAQRGGNANPHVATGASSNSLRLHQPQHSQHQMLQLMPAAVPASAWPMQDIEVIDTDEAELAPGGSILGNGMGMSLLGSSSSRQGQMINQHLMQQQQMMQQQQVMMQQMMQQQQRMLMQTGGGHNSPSGRGGRGRRPNVARGSNYGSNYGYPS